MRCPFADRDDEVLGYDESVVAHLLDVARELEHLVDRADVQGHL
jgi:hypothetical protein